MAFVAEALFAHENPDPDLPPDLAKLVPHAREMQIRAQADAALEAMDAIGHAERFFALNHIHRKTQQASTERSRKAARIRVKPFNDLRQRVIEIYLDNYTRRSNREAASHIWDKKLTDVEKTVLTADDPKKRLEIWIGQHKRTQSSK